MNDETLKNLITGVGAVCEIAGIIRDNLIKNGFTREEACGIVSNFIAETFTNVKGE